MVIQEFGTMPGTKLAPLTTPFELMEGAALERLELTNTHTAPAPLLSEVPPTRAVLPSAASPTEMPCFAFPIAPVPTSLLPCWLHTLPARLYTQTAPTLLLSLTPATSAVLPSEIGRASCRERV